MTDKQSTNKGLVADALTQAHHSRMTWQIDHIVPKRQGGTDDIGQTSTQPTENRQHYKRCLDNERNSKEHGFWRTLAREASQAPQEPENGEREKAEGVSYGSS